MPPTPPDAPAEPATRPLPDNPQAPLTPRQEAFCEYYLTQPTGTLAAVLAGYSPKNARFQASRMLTRANILRRVAELRHDRGIVYQQDADALLDKLEAVYYEAMETGRLSAAIHAVAHQARLSGLLPGVGRAAHAYGFLVADIAQATAHRLVAAGNPTADRNETWPDFDG